MARDAPTPDLRGRIHDAAHMYPDASWGEIVMRGRAEAWWEKRELQYQERPEVAAQIERLRAEAVQRNAGQQAAHSETLDALETGRGNHRPWKIPPNGGPSMPRSWAATCRGTPSMRQGSISLMPRNC